MFILSLTLLYSVILASVFSSQAISPVRLSPISQRDCSTFPIGDIKKNISDIIDSHFLPNHNEGGCNCSQLIDTARNESCITTCCGEGQLIFDTDLNGGSSFLAPGSGLSWLSSLYNPPSQTCDRQGVLRINFREACNFTQYSISAVPKKNIKELAERC